MAEFLMTEEQFEEAVLAASRRELLRVKRAADKAIAKARADGIEEGRREVNLMLKGMTLLNGHGPRAVQAIDRLMKAEDEDEPQDGPAPDLANAYSLAAVDLAIDAKENDSDPAPMLEALAGLLDDPEGLSEALEGLDSDTVAKAVGQVVLLKGSWDESKHPRDKSGRFIGKDAIADAKNDPAKADELRARVKPEDAGKLEDALSGKTDLGRTKKGEAKEGAKQRAKSKEERLARVKEIRHSISRLTHSKDDLLELAEHLPHLPIAELRKIRGSLEQDGASFGGARRRDAMVAALVGHAKRIAGEQAADAIDPLDFGALVDYQSTGTPREALSRWVDAPLRAGMEASVERGGGEKEEPKPVSLDTAVEHPDLAPKHRNPNSELKRRENALVDVRQKYLDAKAKADADMTAENVAEDNAAATEYQDAVKRFNDDLRNGRISDEPDLQPKDTDSPQVVSELGEPGTWQERLAYNGADLSDPKAVRSSWGKMDTNEKGDFARQVGSVYRDASPEERSAIRQTFLDAVPESAEDGKAGDTVPFDATLHDSDDPSVRPGDPVQVQEPGLALSGHLKDGGGKFMVARAKVAKSDSPQVVSELERHPTLTALEKERQSATPRGKELLRIALGGLPNYQEPEALANGIARRLASAHRQGSVAGDSSEDLAPLERLAKLHGMTKTGEAGGTDSFDGTFMESETMIQEGQPVRVVHPGWRLGDYQQVKAKVEPAPKGEAKPTESQAASLISTANEIRANPTLEGINAFQPQLEKLSKTEVEDFLRSYGFTPDGSKKAMISRVISSMKTLAHSRQNVRNIERITGSASAELSTRIKDTIERTRDPRAVSDQEVEDLLAEVAKLPDAEQNRIAKEVTGRGGRGSKQALMYLRADLTAVKRALESQKV